HARPLRCLPPRLCLSALFLYCSAHHRELHSFPTRRSSDLRPPWPGAWRTVACVGDRAAQGPRRLRRRRAHAAEGCGVLRRVRDRSEEHTSELQSRENLVCRLLLEKKKNQQIPFTLSVDLRV